MVNNDLNDINKRIEKLKIQKQEQKELQLQLKSQGVKSLPTPALPGSGQRV